MNDKVIDMEVTPKRGRGRPKGSGGIKRPDCAVQTNPGDNTKYLNHALTMFKWDDPDMESVEQVSTRIADYFDLCAENDMKPSVAGLALAFGVSRETLTRWTNGTGENRSRILPAGVRHTLKKAYQILNAQMEDYMQNGKINPVAGIFLMKNNMGYQDKQEVVLTPNQPLGEQLSPEDLQQKYLTDIAAEIDEN